MELRKCGSIGTSRVFIITDIGVSTSQVVEVQDNLRMGVLVPQHGGLLQLTGRLGKLRRCRSQALYFRITYFSLQFSNHLQSMIHKTNRTDMNTK